MHWRGDRSGAGKRRRRALNERLAFKKFNAAFVTLLGRSRPLRAADLRAFTDFILTLRYPPNPLQPLLTLPSEAQRAGRAFFSAEASFRGTTCGTCHVPPLGTGGTSAAPTIDEPQQFKVPHLRNLYQKVGMFGLSPNPFGVPVERVGDQIRGFGFLHDGSVPTIFSFLRMAQFSFRNDEERRNVEAFLLTFDTGFDPLVGQQALENGGPTRVFSLGRNCEIVMTAVIGGRRRGFVHVPPTTRFQPDRRAEAQIDAKALVAVAGVRGQEQLYTCVPLGSGTRMGVDRDEDGVFDGDEIDAGTNPADPADFPSG
jgi:hypothetical protein